jgi:hypothetical protein
VVVTHHTPSARSQKPIYRDSKINGCYHNHFDQWIGGPGGIGPALWVHGHTHASADYVIGNTRVVANPQGYPDGWRGGVNGVPRTRAFENPEYKTDLVLEV